MNNTVELTLPKGLEPVSEVEESRNRSNAPASFGEGPEHVIQVLSLELRRAE